MSISPRNTPASAGRALIAVIISAAVILTLSIGTLAWADDDDALPTDESASARLVDSLGRAVQAPDRAERIAALAPHLAELLIEIGVEPALRPVTPYEPPAALQDVPTISLAHAAGPNLEQLAAARPGLILTSSVYAQFIPTMQRVTGAPVIALDVRSVEDLQRVYTLLGDLTNRPAPAERRIDEIDAVIAARADASPSASPRVFALFGSHAAFYAFLPESYLGDLIRIAGGEPLGEELDESDRYRGFAPVGFETLIAADPDVLIIVAHAGADARLESLRRDPAWSSLRAVREGRVVSLPERFFITSAGARFDEALSLVENALRDPVAAP